MGGVFITQNQKLDDEEQQQRMASLQPADVVVVPHQQIRGEVKQKTLLEAGRNRRALQDIGNLVPDQAVQEKKQIAEVVNAAKAKPKPHEVIEISSDESEKAKPVIRRLAKRKEVKTITSILTARSKAAIITDAIVDVDAADVNNELAVVEYVDEIYKFYKLTEGESRVHDYMVSQREINPKMRSILMDWLTEVHRKFELMSETLFLTINIVDRFLSLSVVNRKELQLVGVSAMLIACKYEEIWAPEVNDFVCISDNAYAREQVLKMEKTILGKLEWYLTVPTPYVFLARYSKVSVSSDTAMENMVFFLAELGLLQYQIIVQFSPSMIAASAVYAARHTLGKNPCWTETLKHYSGYAENQLIECAEMLVGFHSTARESKLRGVYRKFSSTDRGAVALYPPAKSLLSTTIPT